VTVLPLTILALATPVLVIVTAVMPTPHRRDAAVALLVKLTKLVRAITGHPEAPGIDEPAGEHVQSRTGRSSP
jgi:hypothetical protein